MFNIPMTFNPKHQAYLQYWMQRVSRSFAVVVVYIEEPLKEYLSIAYLICRVIDNVEDAIQKPAWKADRFDEVANLIQNPGLAVKTLANWEKEVWAGLTSDQQRIMLPADGTLLWELYAQIPDRSRQIISHWTLEMVAGMRVLGEPRIPPQLVSQKGIDMPGNEQDYNDYCYIVAGTVGHMATELAIQHYGIAEENARKLLAGAEACGRGLQKTNILKDFAADLGRKVSYLPDEWLQTADYAPLSLQGAPIEWKFQVIYDVMNELSEATNYVLDLPVEALGYRRASLLCLFPAYQTILLAARDQERLFTPEHDIKISHQTMEACVQDAMRLAGDDLGILEYRLSVQAAVEQTFQVNSLS
jgi:farnesyl-diphosphate farnesyltransferase